MTRDQRRWAVRILREAALYYGLQSGGAIRRGKLGAIVAQVVCCRLLCDLGLSPDDAGGVLRVGERDVRQALWFVRKHSSLRRDMDAITTEAFASELGLECGPCWRSSRGASRSRCAPPHRNPRSV